MAAKFRVGDRVRFDNGSTFAVSDVAEMSDATGVGRKAIYRLAGNGSWPWYPESRLTLEPSKRTYRVYRDVVAVDEVSAREAASLSLSWNVVPI